MTRMLITTFLAGLLTASAALAGATSPDSAKHPHIVILFVDDMGYGDAGCYNPESKIPTPHTDGLARAGMRFTNAHAPGPLCHPSRYGLLTGRYPFRTDVNAWPRRAVIEEGRMTIASLLQSGGYRTVMVGKWHLGFDERGYDEPLPGGPADRGFDEFFGIRASTDIPPYFYIRGDRAVEPPTERIADNQSPGWSPIQGAFWRGGGIAPNLKLEEVLPRFTEESIAAIKSHGDRPAEQPLFLYVALPAPHTPWLPAKPFEGRSGAGMYGDFLMMVDHEIGRILKALDEADMADDALVIFTSDNGPVWYPADVERFGHDSAGGLRGMKGDAWEAGHRMPFVVRWPGRIAAGSVSRQVICFTDLLATFAAILDSELPPDAGEDSFNVLPVLLGEQPEEKPIRPAVVVPAMTGMLSIRSGPWKLIDGLGSGGFSDPRRVEPEPGGPTGQLYHFDDDPGETKNLWLAQPEIRNRLLDELQRIRTAGSSQQPVTTDGADEEKLVLVEKGVSRAPIIVAEGASPETVRAAEELAGYIKKTSGARPDIIKGNPDPAPARAIWVGFQPRLSELFPAVRFALEKPEEILIVAGESHLAIAGRDRTVGGVQTEYGTANAVYTFLQEYLHVRWLWPGEVGEDVLRQETIAFAPFEHRYSPPFRQRGTVLLRSALDARRGLSHDWSRLQRLQLDSFHSHAGGHAYVDWWERFHEDHPDFFALQPDGTRSAYPEPKTVKLCESNPAVWDQWLADAVAMIERGDHRYHGSGARRVNMIPASPNDSHSSGQCVCENCRAWDNPDGTPWRYHYKGQSIDYVAMTDRYVTFWNHLAAKLKERYPKGDVLVGVSAYGPSMPPPVEARLAENTVLRYVGHFPFTTESSREEQKAEWVEWAKTAPHMFYRPNLWYWGGGLWGWPEVAMTKTAEDFRFLAENRCMGLAVDTVWEHWATQGPQYYVMAQLAWDPYRDHQAILDDYYRRGFGKAAGEIAEYWTMMEEARDNLMASPNLQLGSRYRLTVIAAAEQVYTPEFLKRADNLLQRAAAKVAAEPDVYSQRVAFVRDGFDVFRLMIESIPLMKRVRESAGKDADAVRQAHANWETMETTARQAGPHAFNFSFILARMRSGYMGGVEDHLGPPSEKFREAAGLR